MPCARNCRAGSKPLISTLTRLGLFHHGRRMYRWMIHGPIVHTTLVTIHKTYFSDYIQKSIRKACNCINMYLLSLVPVLALATLSRAVVGPGVVTGNVNPVADPTMCKSSSGEYFIFCEKSPRFGTCSNQHYSSYRTRN